jgi:hypothetical protein
MFISTYMALQASTDANAKLTLLHAPCARTRTDLRERVCILTNIANLLLTFSPNRYPKLDNVTLSQNLIIRSERSKKNKRFPFYIIIRSQRSENRCHLSNNGPLLPSKSS